jgi:Ca2+-binding EF-hand superfamily protein
VIPDNPIKRSVQILFEKFDKDGDGRLSKEEVRVLIRGFSKFKGKVREVSEEEVEHFISKIDFNKDGQVQKR